MFITESGGPAGDRALILCAADKVLDFHRRYLRKPRPPDYFRKACGTEPTSAKGVVSGNLQRNSHIAKTPA